MKLKRKDIDRIKTATIKEKRTFYNSVPLGLRMRFMAEHCTKMN